MPVWLACFGSGGVGSGGFLCWRRGMGGFFGGWRAIWLGTHGFGGRVLCCWGDVEAAVVAAGLASRGRMGIAGVACLFRLWWSWFRRLLRWRRRSGRFGGGERTFSEGLYGRFCKKVETAAQWQVWPGAAGFDVGDRGLFTGAGWKVVRRGSKYGSETGARGAALAGSVWLRRRFWVRRRGLAGWRWAAFSGRGDFLRPTGPDGCAEGVPAGIGGATDGCLSGSGFCGRLELRRVRYGY